MTQAAPMCVVCKHRDAFTETQGCDAYPGGIPESIYSGGADHRKPLPGDHDVQFKPDPSIDPQLVEDVLALYEEE